MSESGSDSGSGSEAGSPPRDKRKVSVDDGSPEVSFFLRHFLCLGH